MTHQPALPFLDFKVWLFDSNKYSKYSSQLEEKNSSHSKVTALPLGVLGSVFTQPHVSTEFLTPSALAFHGQSVEPGASSPNHKWTGVLLPSYLKVAPNSVRVYLGHRPAVKKPNKQNEL